MSKTYCKQKYIGETDRELRGRISEHRENIHNKKNNLGYWGTFQSPWSYLSDMKVTILEKVKKHDEAYRKE